MDHMTNEIQRMSFKERHPLMELDYVTKSGVASFRNASGLHCSVTTEALFRLY